MWHHTRTLLLVLSISCITAADIPIPKCNAGNIDPGTGLTCGKNANGVTIPAYGYDETWVVETQEDTVAKTKYISVNGKWPPPPVNVTVSQRIRIKLVNSMKDKEAVTLHFHGILQEHGYVTMDGPQGLTQSPIMPGQNFTYDFPVNKAGTFWIHSHATGQYPKGLRSPLIVTDPADPDTYSYDKFRDYTVTISDWWPNFWNTLVSYHNASDPGNCGVGIEIPPAKIIVNDNAPSWGNSVSDSGLSYFVAPNAKARFRFINLSAFARYYIHLDTYQEDITIIEIDGVIINEQVTKGIELASGQRVSVTIKGPETADQKSRKIIIVSDPRISSNANTKPECKLPTNKPAGESGDSFTQYAWAFIDSVGDNVAVRAPPVLADLNGGEDIKVWKDSDTYGRPYLSRRPRMDFTIQVRPEVINDPNNPPDGTINVHIPENAWKFNETAFIPLDNDGPWMVGDGNIGESHIHAILLNDTDGYGTMNLRVLGREDELTTKFPQPEKPQNPQQASTPGFDDTTTLMRAIRSDHAVNKTYENPLTYSDWSHTIVMKTFGEVHWFVIRAKRGDHPIHMHGHEFQILAKLPTITDQVTRNPRDFDFNSYDGQDFYARIYNKVKVERPDGVGVSRRDTLMAEKGWDYVIAIKAENPGVWAVHCHNDFHADTGMFMQLVEVPSELRKAVGVWDVGQANRANCGGCYQPWVSKSGSISKKYSNDYSNTNPGIWGPIAQTFRTSFQYYGCPVECYAYHFSDIAV